MTPEEQEEMQARLDTAFVIDSETKLINRDLESLEKWGIHVCFQSKNASGHTTGQGWMGYRGIDNAIKDAVISLLHRRRALLQETKAKV